MSNTSDEMARAEEMVNAEQGSGEIVIDKDPRLIAPHALGLELPADPALTVQLLLHELEEAREEAGSYLADLQRVAADFDNFRQRMLRGQAGSIERASPR